MTRRLAAVLTTLAAAGPAAACPLCDGEFGYNPVRSAVFGNDFWFHAFCAGLPFAVALALAAFIHFGGPPTWGPRR